MTLSPAEQFFYDNAAWSYEPATQTCEEGHIETAKALAKAERALNAGLYYVTVEPDHNVWNDGPVWSVAILSDEGNPDTDEFLAGVGGVACAREDDYIRVVSAELALEAGL